jgi:hexosaminidase
MKSFLLFAMLVILAQAAAAQGNSLNIIPRPAELQTGRGSLTLTAASAIRYNQPKGRAVAEMLAARLGAATGFKLKVSQGSGGAIQLILNASPDAQSGAQGYRLEVSSGSAVIRANEPAGLYYGTQTLLQLLPPEIESATPQKAAWTIPAVVIADYPRFGWRGLMLDVSRHFFTVDEVKAYIDRMALYKLNTLHLHLTDDNGWRLEIKSLPKLTEVGAWRVERHGRFGERADPKPGEPETYGGFYSHDDIRELVRYAAERFVTIVPEIDVPGHSLAAIAAYPELSCTKDPNARVNPGTAFSEWYGNGTFRMLVDNTLNPSDERVYEFLDKVFTEVAELFPNPYIHVGGDECYKGYWAQDPGCRALMKKLNIRHVEDLQGYFMNRVAQILEAKGKKLLGWDEILEGGIAKGATVMSWRGVAGGIEAAHMGHDVVMSPTTFAYIDYQQGEASIEPPIYAGLRARTSYSFNPVPEGVDAKYILGGQGNLWTEQVPTLRHAEYMTWPRGWALSEVYWTPNELKNWDDFARRMEAHFVRSEFARVNYAKAVYDPIITTTQKDGVLVLHMEPEIPGLDIFYTIDDSMPDRFSPRYTGPVDLPEGPITLRVRSYRNGAPIGHLITLSRAALQGRANR